MIRLRNLLLAEHLGMSPDAVDTFLSGERSLVRLVDSRRGNPRCLRELPCDTPQAAPMIARDLVDPSGPLTAGGIIEGVATSVADQPARRLLPLAIAGVAAAALVFVLVRQLRATSARPTR